MRSLLISLGELVDAGTVFKTFGGVTREELHLLALVESEVNKANEVNHG